MKSITDEELVVSYRAGEVDAFNELHKRYKNAILSYAHSVYCIGADLEDVIQEGMLGLLNAINYYNGKSSFKNYAFLCIKTSIIKAVTRSFSNKDLPLNSTVSINDCETEINRISENPEDEIIFKEKIDAIKLRVKQEFSSFEQEVLNLFLQGYSYAEIAKKLNCTAKQCDNVLQKIKKKLSN
ncbi:MAG: sigma-70 family RNA polymerase sigma factor [Clostridia bacterium]|nr:sigma-70 family RNA polymerase sigma factor [Clostridia bacterium]